MLAPVRIFPVKGIEHSIHVVDHMCAIAKDRGRPQPHLLIFGALCENPGYAASLHSLVGELSHANSIHFLDGVPLKTVEDHSGTWRFDEVDLLRMCQASGGGILFTPSVMDVESVGLGPALAGLIGVPCATTPFTAFDDIYGSEFQRVLIEPTTAGYCRAAQHLTDALASAASAQRLQHDTDSNTRIIHRLFPDEPWLSYLRELHRDVHTT